MKQKILIQLLILLCSLTSHAQIPKPFVIPELKEWKGAEGTFTPTNGGRIVYSARQPELKTTATTFAEDLRLMFGSTWTVSTDKARPGDIELTLHTKRPKHSPEEYEINIGKKVRITAPQSRWHLLGNTLTATNHGTERSTRIALWYHYRLA